jgi:nocturnin
MANMALIAHMSLIVVLLLVSASHRACTVTEIYPKLRKFLTLPGRYALTPTSFSGSHAVILRVQQFNVLADGLAGLRADQGSFSRASRDVLDFSRRKHQILLEITQYNADIITLQECDHYYDFFLPELQKHGYQGYFAPKPTSACLEVSNNSDGCALFVKTSQLSVVSIETKTLALSVAALGDGGEVQEDDKNIKAQNQVAIIAVCALKNASYLRSLYSGKPSPGIIIATTHLKSSKTSTGERHRLFGIRHILNQVYGIYSSLEDRGKTPAVILTGDFNAVSEEIGEYSPLTFKAVKAHVLGLRSVYEDDIPLSMNKLSSKYYTTWKSRLENGGERITRRATDYIFYSTFRNGVYKNSFDDVTQLKRRPVSASFKSQIAISFLLRIFVYLFAIIIPLSSLLSSEISNLEQFTLFSIGASLLSIFELSSDGTVFKPQLAATINSLPDTCAVNSSDKAIDMTTTTDISKSSVLSDVGGLTQQILPLKQYGRPGFQSVQALDVLSDDEVGPNYIPSDTYPSDHISIVADLHLLW